MKKKTVTQAEEHHFRWTDDSLDRERRITAPVVARRAKSLLALSFASQSVGCGASNRCSSRFRSRRRPVVSRIFFPHCLLASKEQVCAIFATVAFEMFIKYVDVFMDEGYASDSSNVVRILILRGL